MKICLYVVERCAIEVLWIGIAVSFGWAAGSALPDQNASLFAWVIDLWFWAFLAQIAMGIREMKAEGYPFVIGQIIGFTGNIGLSVLSSLRGFCGLFFAWLVIAATTWAAAWFNRNCAPILRRHFE